ncbi:ABC transporter permease [Falsiroseomonas sp.]|uniref:ABC transporter permease n=1 Tax=Falsiroseomonas sp. TaxID=2870721 RepID=UPI003F71AD84
MRILRLALRRLMLSVPCLAIILAGLFFLLQLAPGDAVDALIGQMGSSDDTLSRLLRSYYGLDGSVMTQFAAYLGRLASFDLGVSIAYGRPVLALILERLPVTVVLMVSAMTLAFVGGCVVGVVAARYVHRWPDTLISVLGMLVYAMPSFWFGLMAIMLFAVTLGWLPAGGLSDLRAGHEGLALLLDMALHLLLPTLTLALIFFAVYLRVMRTAMLEVMTLDFMRTARAKGVREGAVLFRHALRNALLPMVTIAGLQASSMLGGAVVVESVFSLPGLGRLAQEAVVQRDLNMMLGIVIMSAVLVVVVNLVIDLIYARLDPRIDVEG